MSSPSEQRDRPIRFQLMPGGASHDLYVRPEDLTRTEPFRTTVHNTLGGAYVDAWGRGVGMIQIAGVTGWRGGQNGDGIAEFEALRSTILEWSRQREAKVAAAQSPDDIELVMADSLDRFALVVAPAEFTLRRSKQRPLLFQYSLRFFVVADLSDPKRGGIFDSILDSISNIGGKLSGALGAIGDIANFQGGAASFLGGLGKTLGSFAGAASGFLNMSKGLLDGVIAGVNAVTGFVSSTLRPILNLATAVQQAGRNIFRAIGAIAGLPFDIASEISRIASMFSGAYCALVNGFNLLKDMFDFTGLFGTSNCSSTSGGRGASPYIGKNTFEEIETKTPSLQTPASAREMRAAQSLDPMSNPLTLDQGASRLSRIAAGVYA